MKKLLISFILISIVIFSGCSKKEEVLYDFKTDYVGDNSKVSQIVYKQKYPKNFEPGEIKILSEKEPYGLKIFCKNYNDIKKEELFKNAATTLSLIKNLANLYYVDEEEKEIFTFTRSEVEEKLQKENMSLDKISENEESLRNFINN
ncbi:MAG: DUF4825 domain-containing protein [Peptoniphilus lacydonensis]|uniref:DUF4825 domain-containing protein n=1 Tax=Peptoniphilus lacydonensis TaxID=1673725 RepID=UPI002914112D|nr:DUF4825 domain-containing protein [Peptoniphilus lacydonensis]MDU5274535.1 DUF4825 domain-containing protein [Peptoniphilus lacydonensis]